MPARQLLFLSCLFLFTSIKASQQQNPTAQESDRVINLPGQPSTPLITQFSGYINVNQDHGRALFYWFFEAQSEPSKKPLLLWLNGGPGCSSIGYGAAVELGPLKVQRNGSGLEYNKYAWNTVANLLFLESPVGVGFSYTNTSSDLNNLNDAFVAEDAYNFLVKWLRRFPQYQGHDFYIAGESYGGKPPSEVPFLLVKLTLDITLSEPSIMYRAHFMINRVKSYTDRTVQSICKSSFYFTALHFPINGLDGYGCLITEILWNGHYVPQLAELVYDRNKDKTKYPFVNLKGFIVGNPETDDYYDSKGLVEYAWSHTVISDTLYKQLNRVCDFKLFNWTDECIYAMSIVYQLYSEIDIYNIYAPKCLINGPLSLAVGHTTGYSNHRVGKNRLRMMRIYGGYDPCYETYTEAYFNRLDVQKSLHANVTGHIDGKWVTCNSSIISTYDFTVFSILPIYTKLIKGGLKVWVYSGDTDGRVPVIGSRYCVEALGLPLKNPWRSWYHNHQVGGRFVEYEGLTLATVRGAGHLVPFNKPSEALLLIRSYLLGQTLPTQK